MTHEKAVLRLTDYLQGRLDGQDRIEIAEHVAACTECTELAETYWVLARPAMEKTMTEDHPSTEAIVLYATSGDRLDETGRDRVAAHLLQCTACRSEVELTRTADRDTRDGRIKALSG